ncbi:MAG TPA: NupC/NupG family nucleoside CNT transporter [Vicinamibacteria bacterium]|nr:NupC/NupG family nucleoside CNT transporter [Vicinamibacteria bacterium]
MSPLLAILLAQASDPLAQMRDTNLSVPLAQRLIGLLGLATMLLIAWLMSYDRRRISWRLVAAGLALQGVFGVLVLKTAPGRWFFEKVGQLVSRMLDFVVAGARFAFGYLVDFAPPAGVAPEAGIPVFAFRVLPTIIFVSSLMSVLYYLGVMQWVVKGIAWVMQKTLGTSGAETLSASGNIFLGQTEAPLLIKPFVGKMTPSELFTVMVGGFATVAGGVLAAYVALLQGYFPSIAGHLLAASVMNAPAGLLLAKIIRPETDVPATRDTLRIDVEQTTHSIIESAAEGAAVGVQLAINVAGMLIAFIALVALLNYGIGWVAETVFGLPGLTLQSILGTLLRPLAWVMGVPWQDTAYVGGLIGLKTVLNEFLAYTQFAHDLSAGVAVHPRSAVIAAYALLGFANFSSIAIQLGGIGGLAPERRSEIARFGLRAMIAGNLAAFMSACWAGMLL